MSDFLTSLAARTLGTVRVLTPRLRSHFEPDSLATSTELPESTPPERRSSEERRDREGAFAPPAQWPAAPSGAPADGSSSRAHRPLPDDEPLTRTEAQPVIRPRVPQVARSGEDGGDRGRAGEPADVPAALGTTAPERRALTPGVQPVLARRTMAEPRHPRTQDAAAIHVTIGRVDVRAIYPREPAAPARKTGEEPRVSLGTYLRRRSA